MHNKERKSMSSERINVRNADAGLALVEIFEELDLQRDIEEKYCKGEVDSILADITYEENEVKV